MTRLPGRPANAYDAAEIIRLHAALLPWLRGSTSAEPCRPLVTLTIDEAAGWLDPPITARQLRAIVRALGITPARALDDRRLSVVYSALTTHAQSAHWIHVEHRRSWSHQPE